MNRKKLIAAGIALLALTDAPGFGTAAASAQQGARNAIAPLIAHHQHLLSPTMREVWQPRETAVELPAELAQVLRERERISGNDGPTDIYTEGASGA